ncbi:DUF3108 domain-containing protein [Paraburkholderia tropica]|uniref:DUF3108 domain-containing protein n=1 Tax=Paraburkholderia tropica TaxID=92647 RepID=UPI0016022E9D|nr:DUF3108 domain-containing protein [Paraburkholderia tropica]QNB10257.1 DUF3108 domain-containing protein [Paraburkholderia tropica]
MSTSATENRRNPAGSRPWRWVAVFVAVTVLHWLAAEWFERHHGAPPSAEKVHVPVQVRLLKTERIEQQARPAGAAQTPASKPARPAPAKRAPPPPHTLQAVAPPQPHPHPKVAAAPDTPASSADAASDASAASDALAASAATGASGTAAAKGGGNGNNPAAQAAQASHGLKFSVPPSGELQYDTFYNGVRNQPGTIHWKSDGQHYEMVVEVPLPFVGTFSWTSKGHVDPFGLAPDQYIEKRGRRPADVTVFNRDQKQIVFTRTPNSLALPDGAQDRFSMVMQLASLVRGDPETYKPGVTREFYVADNDSGESWPITTIGDETVSTDHGYVTARHFMRLPRHDGDKRRIDVWLAPALGWLPVRIMQTEPNGNEFELVWRGALVPPGGTSASNAAPDATQNAAPDAASNVAPNAVPTNASPNAAPSTPSTDMTNAPPATPDASSAAAPTAGGSENSNAAPTDAPAVAQPSATPESSSPATPSLPPADAPLHP